jgi:hypothetical protein
MASRNSGVCDVGEGVAPRLQTKHSQATSSIRVEYSRALSQTSRPHLCASTRSSIAGQAKGLKHRPAPSRASPSRRGEVKRAFKGARRSE